MLLGFLEYIHCVDNPEEKYVVNTGVHMEGSGRCWGEQMSSYVLWKTIFFNDRGKPLDNTAHQTLPILQKMLGKCFIFSKLYFGFNVRYPRQKKMHLYLVEYRYSSLTHWIWNYNGVNKAFWPILSFSVPWSCNGHSCSLQPDCDTKS